MKNLSQLFGINMDVLYMEALLFSLYPTSLSPNNVNRLFDSWITQHFLLHIVTQLFKKDKLENHINGSHNTADPVNASFRKQILWL